MSSKLTAKQQRRQALEALKSARSGRQPGGQLDALDDLMMLDDNNDRNRDVYETMDEEQYREYVERKREREDFVVDDGQSVRHYYYYFRFIPLLFAFSRYLNGILGHWILNSWVQPLARSLSPNIFLLIHSFVHSFILAMSSKKNRWIGLPR